MKYFKVTIQEISDSGKTEQVIINEYQYNRLKRDADSLKEDHKATNILSCTVNYRNERPISNSGQIGQI